MGVHALLLTQLDKEDQGIYYKLLQFYLKHGMEIKKIHRILEFDEKPYLRDFILKNLKVRKESKEKLHKQTSKQIGNMVYGMFLSIGNRSNVEVITNYAQATRAFRKHNFKDSRIVSDDLSLGYFERESSVIDKNILVSFVVLERAKLRLYELIYDELKPVFGERMYVAASETDNVVVEIRDPDRTFLQDLKRLEHIFDFSTLPVNHPLFCESRASEPGLLKIEYPYPLQFVGVKAKLYSVLNKCQQCLQKESNDSLDCDHCSGNLQVAKGASRRKKTPHSVYLKAAMNEEQGNTDFLSLQTKNQKVSLHAISRKLFTLNNKARKWNGYNNSVPIGYHTVDYKSACT